MPVSSLTRGDAAVAASAAVTVDSTAACVEHYRGNMVGVSAQRQSPHQPAGPALPPRR